MARAHWLLVVAAASALPASAAPRAKGKVVRVERARTTAVAPRICLVQSEDSGMCFGRQPGIGERVIVMDETAVIAEARITGAGLFNLGRSTRCDSVWKIDVQLVRGTLDSSRGGVLGVVDPLIADGERKARMFAHSQLPSHPAGSSSDKVVVAIDRDGDNSEDIVLTQTTCDGGSVMCFDEWARVGNRFSRVAQLNLASCGM
jgi:hypothetical protein